MSADRLAEIKAGQVARIFEDLGRNRIQQAMSESQESKGSPEWHRFGQGRWAFTHAASVVNRHLGYPVDIWGEWIEEWSPHDLSDEPVLDPAEQDQRDLLAEVARLTAERDALAEGRCMANITLRDDEHRLALCVLPDGHRAAHDDLLGTSWTDETHYDQSEVEVLGPVSAAPDLLAALMQSIEREKQRRRDAVPCDKCGGDRLRADFVNPDRCHAPTTEAQR